MADRRGDTYTDAEGEKTTSVGATSSAGDVAAANARARFDPSMRKPDASSLDAPTGTSPLAQAAAREAARKKAMANPRAKAVKSMLKDGDADDQQ